MPTPSKKRDRPGPRSRNGGASSRRITQRSASLPGVASPRARDPNKRTSIASGRAARSALAFSARSALTRSRSRRKTRTCLPRYDSSTELKDRLRIVERTLGLGGGEVVRGRPFGKTVRVARRHVELVERPPPGHQPPRPPP